MKFVKYVLILLAAFALSAAPQAKKAPAQKPAAAAKAPAAAQIDINTASEKELRELPGIGEAYAAKIIANRPYRAKNQLVQKNVIPQATYDKIRDRIIAKQPGKK